MNAERDRFEVALAQAVLAQGIPVLGICRGMQLLNVVSGGKLFAVAGRSPFPHVPDVYDELDHFNPAEFASPLSLRDANANATMSA